MLSFIEGKILGNNFCHFQNECSFVSLRDVERAMKVIMWFYSNSELIHRVIEESTNAGNEGRESSEESSEDERGEDVIDSEENEQVRFLKV